jgi:hypothetical protein
MASPKIERASSISPGVSGRASFFTFARFLAETVRFVASHGRDGSLE